MGVQRLRNVFGTVSFHGLDVHDTPSVTLRSGTIELGATMVSEKMAAPILRFSMPLSTVVVSGPDCHL